MTQFYVYLHCTPSGDPFYVGKGCDKWLRRSHDLKHARNNYHRNVVAKYGPENIQIFVFPCESEERAFADEIQHIAQLRADGFSLTNMTDGGEGPSGCKYSDEVKQKHRVTQKKTWTGRKHSEESKKKMSESRIGNKYALGGKGPTGTKRSAEFRARMSEIAKNRTYSEATRQKMSDTAKRRQAAKMAAQSGVEPVFQSGERQAAC